MVICLAKYCYLGRSDFFCPSPCKIAVSGKQAPALLPYLSDHLGIEYILTPSEVFIVSYNTETSPTNFRGKIIGPKVSVSKEDRIRRRNM